MEIMSLGWVKEKRKVGVWDSLKRNGKLKFGLKISGKWKFWLD